MSLLTRRELLAGSTALLVAQPASRPNLVLFLSDDHGYRDSSVYGSRSVRTPALAQLASGGMVFEHAYTGAAICIPSRAILSSGLCSHRNGAIANGRQLSAGIRTLPSYLGALGYRVAHFGKSHFLPSESYQDWEWVPSEVKGGGPLNNDLDTSAVERWLTTRNPADKRPLCLIVCCHSPHVTWTSGDAYEPSRAELPPSFVDTPETRDARCRYYADISKMDIQLGQVYRAVRRTTGGNTLFLYTSDNGAQWPFGKWNLYDAGIRMPMVASWPGVIRPGIRTTAMVHFTDILPTFMELAGGKPPSDLDGRSFADVLRGRTNEHRSEIFASHTADDNGHMNCYPMRCMRDPQYKYILNLHPEFAYRTHIDRGVARDGRDYWESWVRKSASDAAARKVIRRYHERPEEELYDTIADPHETVNLAGQRAHGQALARMRKRVREWMEGMSDKGEVFGVPRPLSTEDLPLCGEAFHDRRIRQKLPWV
jgi:arylsulfatase A-like enzyme